jgi:hypothetical protein
VVRFVDHQSRQGAAPGPDLAVHVVGLEERLVAPAPEGFDQLGGHGPVGADDLVRAGRRGRVLVHGRHAQACAVHHLGDRDHDVPGDPPDGPVALRYGRLQRLVGEGIEDAARPRHHHLVALQGVVDLPEHLAPPSPPRHPGHRGRP